MKKTALVLIAIAMTFQLVQCSSANTTSTKPAAKVEPVVESCKKNCNATYGKCMQNAGKNESKKTSCNNAIVKCSANCDKKSKDYKPEPATKYQKSPEI